MSVKSNQYINASDLESDSDSEAYEYQAPKHFKQIEGQSGKLSHKVSKPNTSLYLIKYPKSLSINSIKSLTTTINQGNKSYNVVQSSQNKDLQKYKVFVNKYERYKSVGKNIEKFLTVNELVNLPSYEIDKVQTPRSDVPKVHGLKMRHFPSGYSAEDYFENGAQPTDKPVVEHSQSQVESEPSPKKHKKDKKDKKEKKEKKDKKRDKKDKE